MVEGRLDVFMSMPNRMIHSTSPSIIAGGYDGGMGMRVGTTHSSGLAFSLSVDFLESLPLLIVDLPPKICTCTGC